MNERTETIYVALRNVYGAGSMVKDLAIMLDKKWEELLDTEAMPVEAIGVEIWNWFPGGSTAYMAAGRVLDAVDRVEATT